ncbi:MAG TPA: TIGR03618 family F420-dependent PPOX class oxidoreductase [Actinomycetota bacterium]|nr:TIGR03618 family F420-dependent PPOX class oxidoreductase [Actinomycetota bacterium]
MTGVRAVLSEDDVRFLTGRNVGHLATLLPDGSPHVSPVWVDARDGLILVNTVVGRVKERNVRRDPRVGLSVHDRDRPTLALIVRGRVVGHREEGALEHIDALSRRYDGVPWTPVPGQRRVILEILPERIVHHA